MKNKKILVLVGAFLLLGVMVAPLHAQEDSIVWVGVPIALSYQFPLQEVPGINSQNIATILSRLDLDLGLQLFFRLGDTVSLGVESGISAPIADYIYLATRNVEEVLGYPFHVPLRVVLNVGTGGTNIDIFGGTNFNIIFNRNATTTLTADVGMRLNFSSFFLMLGYSFPFETTIGDTATAAIQNYWQNLLRVGVGFRIGGP